MEEISQPKIGSTRQSFHLQFITTPTVDTIGTTMILHFDDKRYIFGRVSEGTQRACMQRGVSLRKIRNIFLTGPVTWQNNGGLIGLILTLADVQQGERENDNSDKRPRLNIHGGPRLLHTMACARRFVFRTSMPLTVHQNPPDNSLLSAPTFADENICVWAVNLGKSEDMEQDNTPGTKNQSIQERSDLSVRNLNLEQDTRREIVRDMFDSDWRKDRLLEMPFKSVKLPATVWIRDPQTKQLQDYNCSDKGSAPTIDPDQVVLVRNPWPASLIGVLPSASNVPGESATSYIVKGHPQRGAFDTKKAMALGVKPGPDFRKLTLGESVTASTGEIVQPEQVLGPTRPGRGFAVFDISQPSQFTNLERQLVTVPSTVLDGVETMVWITNGSEILPKLKALAKSMENIKHVVAQQDLSGNYLALDSSALSTCRLNNISSSHFPLPIYDNGYHESELFSQNFNDHVKNFLVARRALKIQIEPQHVIDESEVPPLIDLPQHVQTSGQAQFELDQHSSIRETQSGSPLVEPEIITLGTGSAMPSKYRNVSATLLRMPNNLGNYLFDCGENTLGQLQRLFTATELNDVLTNLRAIWISHLHADHHLGTISILRARHDVQQKPSNHKNQPSYPVCVMSEVNMLDFLNEYSPIEPYVADPRYVTSVVCSPSEGSCLHGRYEPIQFKDHGLPFKDLQTARVSHCHGAQAVSITFENGFKFSYSGDCRPSERFTEIGKHSDVLLHEATFEDGMDGDAMAKKHSTTSEALGVALKMQAKNVILTHFSQRYQKIPVLSNVKLPDEVKFEEGDVSEAAITGPMDDGTDAVNEFTNAPLIRNAAATTKDDKEALRRAIAAEMHICVAFDYMRVRVSEIENMRKIFPAIEQMFEEQEVAAEQEKKMTNEKRKAEIAQKKLEYQTRNRGKAAGKQEAASLESVANAGPRNNIRRGAAVEGVGSVEVSNGEKQSTDGILQVNESKTARSPPKKKIKSDHNASDAVSTEKAAVVS